jgi:uroporphyrinogen-III decarboxylase
MDYAIFQAGAALMKRSLAAKSERIPVSAQMHEFVAAQMGIAPRTFYGDPAVMVPAMLAVQAAYGLDVASITYDVYNIEAEALGQRLLLTDAAMPDIDRSFPLIRDKDDLKLIKTPDFANNGRFAVVLERHAIFHRLTGLQPTLSFCAPFTLAANLRGIEQLLMDIYSDPPFAAHLLDLVTNDILAPWIACQKQHFPHATSISGADAIASLPIVNMHILREWALPYIRRLRETCDPAVYVGNWVGERLSHAPQEMLDLKLSACGRLIQGQDPDVEALGPELYKDFAERHNVPLSLGIGAAFLAARTPDEITHRVHTYLHTGARGGRFAFYICNVGATTPPQNLRAAVDAAHGFDPASV